MISCETSQAQLKILERGENPDGSNEFDGVFLKIENVSYRNNLIYWKRKLSIKEMIRYWPINLSYTVHCLMICKELLPCLLIFSTSLNNTNKVPTLSHWTSLNHFNATHQIPYPPLNHVITISHSDHLNIISQIGLRYNFIAAWNPKHSMIFNWILSSRCLTAYK